MAIVIATPSVSSPTFACSFDFKLSNGYPQEPQPITIGVLELDPNNVSQEDCEAISARLRIFLAQQDVFDVMERNKMVDILTEQGFQISGACADDECVVEIGHIIGVSKMIAGEVSVVGTVYSLQLRLIDISTSKIEHQAFRDVDGIEQVLQVVTKNLSEELARMVSGAARITLQSTLSGTSLRIEGDAEQRVTLLQADERIFIDPGNYRISLSAPGYKAIQMDVELEGGESFDIPVNLSPKSRGAAGIFSLLIPGMGQLYEGRTGWGILTLLTTSCTAIFTLQSLNDYSTHKSDYNELIEDFNEAVELSDLLSIQLLLNEKHNNMKESSDRLDVFTKVLGGLWVLNVIDAIVRMPRMNRISNPVMSTGLSLKTVGNKIVFRIVF